MSSVNILFPHGGERVLDPIVICRLWGLQASNEAGSLIRPLEAPCFMKLVRTPRVGLVARCTLEGAWRRYPDTFCFTQVARQAVFIVLETPVRGLHFARPGPGARRFGFRLTHASPHVRCRAGPAHACPS